MSIFNSFKGILEQAGAAAAPTVISEVLAKTGFGDLQTVVAKLEEAGLGAQVQSWLGSGANLPISADQLRSALGDERVQEIAQHLGIPLDDALKLLAEHLPTAVDQASSDGSLPPANA